MPVSQEVFSIPENILKIRLNIPFAEGSVNVYVLPGTPVTLVDTGISKAESLLQLERGLREFGLSLQQVEQIVLTHLHTDHAGGLGLIGRYVDVPVYMHERARDTVHGGESEFLRVEKFFHDFIHWSGAPPMTSRQRSYRNPGWKNVHFLRHGDTLPAGGRRFTVLYVPGHSQTDICLYDEETGEAIVGDHLLKDISANAFVEAPAPGVKERLRPLLQFRESMERTRELPFTTVYPGHGEPYVGHQALIEQRFQEHEERCDHILSLLRAEPQTVYQLSRTMFPWLEGSAVFLGLSEVQGHLDLLAERNLVKTNVSDGVATYHACDI